MGTTSKRQHSFIKTKMFLMILIVLTFLTLISVKADVKNMERVSVGTNGVEADESSFYGYLSNDGRYVTFESYATNWSPDQNGNDDCFGNCVDIFVRDRVQDKTTRVTIGYNGEPTNEDSFHPIITADGRYIAYSSYASNLVPGDTNRDAWSRNGLDVFLYDRLTAQTQRVSLNWSGGQIKGNSVGVISGDSHYIYFASNGDGIVQNESNSQLTTNIYMRDWRAGTNKRITSDFISGGFPNDTVNRPQTNYDGRYVVYESYATNLTPNDNNGHKDIFLYDRNSDQTILISKPFNGGQSNGDSSSAEISSDGKFVIFLSEAANLVPGDTNGFMDIFVYTVDTAQIKRVNVSDSDQQANGLSVEASICGDGSVVSFTSEATNLVPGDTNNHRDVFFYSFDQGKMSVATINNNQVLGNGKAHRSFLAPDCQSIVFASSATNLILNDLNDRRDLFMAQITWLANLGTSSIYYPATATPGEQITIVITIRNSGTETAVATLTNPIPVNTTFVSGTEYGGAVYNASMNRIEWNGSIVGGEEISLGYELLIDGSLTNFTMIDNQLVLTGDGVNHLLHGITVVNGLSHFLPLFFSK